MNTLRDILGKPAMGALVLHYHLDDQAESPGQVHETLGSLFGNGAVVLEKLIVRELYHELNVALEEPPRFDFETSVSIAKERLRNDGRGSR